MDALDVVDDVVLRRLLPESPPQRHEREMRTQHNQLVPIARFPPEILAHIFVRCVPTSIDTLRNDLSWLNVTRVSSQWRKVALACPEFWSTPIFSHPKWTPVMLARSKMASLVVRVDLEKDQANSPEPILLENASRLGTLDIRAPQRQLTMFLANLEQADAAHRLQDIRVVMTETTDLWDFWDPALLERAWLPRNLFRRKEVLENVEGRKIGSQPGVRLHLERCAFPWDSEWYSHLAHLHLEDISPDQRPTMKAFLTILVGCRNLETLTIIRCLPFPGDPLTIELPRLTLLTIEANPSCLSFLLSCLIVPPSTIIHTSSAIHRHYDPQLAKELTDTIYEDLIPIFSEDLSTDMYDTVRIDYRKGFTYSLHHSARSEWSRNLRIEAAHWGHPEALRLTESVCDNLDFSHITTLHLDDMPLMSVKYPAHAAAFPPLSLWDIMGRKLPHVHTLHLHKSFPGAWLEFMLAQAMLLIGVSARLSCFNAQTSSSRGLPFRGPDGVVTHACPELRRLVLHEIDLGVPSYKPRWGEVFCAFLWARRQGNAPIWQLDLDECINVSAHDLARFKLLADVVCNGKLRGKCRPTDEEDNFLRSLSIGAFSRMSWYFLGKTEERPEEET